MLKLENIQAGYGNILALKNVSLEINQGEIITLIGANGAGKSTTLMTISGVVSCRSGKILFNGDEIQRRSSDEIVKMGLCQVPEGRHIFPLLTVKENLDMGAFLRNDKAEIKKDLEYVFSLFPILAERRHQDGGTLSGGEQQMLAVGRAMMSARKLMLLDEPSMGLAPLLMMDVFSALKEINDEGTTILLVEQNARMALQFAQRGYVLESGNLVLEGKSEDLLANPEVKKAYLGG